MSRTSSVSPLAPISSLLSGGAGGFPGQAGAAAGGFRQAGSQGGAFGGVPGAQARGQMVASPQAQAPQPAQAVSGGGFGGNTSVSRPTPLNFGVPAWFQGLLGAYGLHIPQVHRHFAGNPGFGAFGQPASGPGELLQRLVS